MKPSLTAKIVSVTPGSGYEGVIHTQRVAVQIGDRVLYVQDGFLLVDATYIGKICQLQLRGFSGRMIIQERTLSSIEVGDDNRDSLQGEVLELETTSRLDSGREYTKIELLLDIGDGTVHCSLERFSSSETESDWIPEGLERGSFVKYYPIRIDLEAIECS